MNDDPNSMAMLPELQGSLMDKIIVLKVQRAKKAFPDSLILERMIQKELPHFLAWLTKYRPPKEVVGNSRFGVKHHFDTKLFQEARASSEDQAFVEILQTYLAEWKVSKTKDGKAPEAWVGTATQLFYEMSESEVCKFAIRGEYSVYRVGTSLKAMASHGYQIARAHTSKGNVWTLPTELERKLKEGK
jgi:hypothetical protein